MAGAGSVPDPVPDRCRINAGSVPSDPDSDRIQNLASRQGKINTFEMPSGIRPEILDLLTVRAPSDSQVSFATTHFVSTEWLLMDSWIFWPRRKNHPGFNGMKFLLKIHAGSVPDRCQISAPEPFCIVKIKQNETAPLKTQYFLILFVHNS